MSSSPTSRPPGSHLPLEDRVTRATRTVSDERALADALRRRSEKVRRLAVHAQVRVLLAASASHQAVTRVQRAADAAHRALGAASAGAGDAGREGADQERPRR